MSNLIFKYPLDLTGTATTNKVVNEEHVIGAVRARIFIADGGPFYGNETSLIDLETGIPLTPGTDYKLLHEYAEAEERTNQPVYAGVQIVNTEISNRIGMTTQYVGGEFSYSYYALVEAVTALENDDRPIYWGDLLGVPSSWVPAPHLHDITNSYNWKSVVDAIMLVEEAVRNGDTTSQQLLVDTLNIKMTLLEEYKDNLTTEWAAYQDVINTRLNDLRVNLAAEYTPSQVTITSSLGNDAAITAATDEQAGVMTSEMVLKFNTIEQGAQKNIPADLSNTPSETNVIISSSTGESTTIPGATIDSAGVMTAAQVQKFNTIEQGAQKNVATNLGVVRSTTALTITSSTGNNVGLPVVNSTQPGIMTPVQQQKLDGIEAEATADQTGEEIVALLANEQFPWDPASLGMFGYNYRWVNVVGQRTYDTVYQNNRLKPIQVNVMGNGDPRRNVYVSQDQNNWVQVGRISSDFDGSGTSFMVSPGHYYKVVGATGFMYWAEYIPL